MLNGKCLCGTIRYEVLAEPASRTNCHCSLCRRASGASPVAWFTVPLSCFRFTAGAPSEYRSSEHGLRKFCGHCGTPLTFQSSKLPDEIDITTCSLDTPAVAAPQSHIYTSSKMDWAVVDDGLPVYKESSK